MVKLLKKEKQGNKRRITILGFIKFSYKKNSKKYYSSLNFPELSMPENHKIFEYMGALKYYDRNLSRLLPIVIEKYKNLPMIDIGANIGDTLAILRNDGVFCPTLCIEGDDEYFPYLQKNTEKYDDVTLKKIFLGAMDEIKKMSVVRDNAGTSHLDNSEKQVEILTLDTVLNNYEKFQSAKFLKIDTDGFDNIVLKGAKNYLAKTKPIIFMEYFPDDLARQGDNGLDVFNYLTNLGYKKALMYANVGELMFSFNVFDSDFIEEMRDFFTKNERIPYCDLCLFHEEDLDLFVNCRRSELDFFRKEKNSD